jgi:hypothetical protein
MDTPLIGPETMLGLPAPYWFVAFFKVFGFTLHMIPMNLWYAGLITLLLAGRFGGENARRLRDRFIKALPILIALGINFGIVPLLFTQVGYYQSFYPATILMAWPWFSVIFLVMFAYYGVYIYVVGLNREAMGNLRRLAGWGAAGIFMVVGFLFANGFSLMTNTAGWPAVMQATGHAGAALGIGLNTADPSLWPRWLMMFGLALLTTSAYVVVDTAFFARRESETYRAWARKFALGVSTVGVVWFGSAGSWYFFGTLAADIRSLLLASPLMILTGLTALSPGLPWLLTVLGLQREGKGLALLTALAQYGVLALNAVSRQIVQNAELAPAVDVTAQPVNLQLSPMIVFLVLFVVGLGVVYWMVTQAVAAARRPASEI